MLHEAVYKESTFEKISRSVTLFILAPLLLLLALPVAIHIAQKPETGFRVHRLQVVALDEGGPADQAGLHLGDRIVAIDGQAIDSMAEFYTRLAGSYDRHPLTVSVQRMGLRDTLVIQPQPPTPAVMVRSYSQWIAGLCFLVIGWWVAWRRRDPVARNFLAVCMIFAFFLLDIPDHPNVAYMHAKDLLRSFLTLLLAAFFLRFFLQFPSYRGQPRGEPSRYRLLLLPAWILFACDVAVFLFSDRPEESAILVWLEVLSAAYMIPCFVTGLFVFARRIRQHDRPIQRTKMQVVLAGLVLGLVPFLITVWLANVVGNASMANWQYLGFSLLLVPISFGLAIMRYGALDKVFIIRASLIYGLLTVLVLVVYFAVVVGVGHFLGRAFAVNSYPVLVVLMAASSLAILPLRRVVQDWIDRTFYPARRANRKAMGLLADELAGLINPEDVTATLLDRLGALFRPAGLVLFLKTMDEDSDYAGFELAPVRLDPTGEITPRDRLVVREQLPSRSGLATLLRRLRRPLFAEEIEDQLFTDEVDDTSLAVLTRLQAHLLVPLISGNQLQGFLAFGAKSSQALYGQEDLANLRALGVQAASALESRQLYRNLLQRKRLETELELARDIQARLLPPDALSGDSFIIAGRNRPCRMVGGDYFDYFLRPDGTLVFAIADVAGKGIPAALQMTSLRVAFRLEVEKHDSAGAVVASLNQVVASTAKSGAFVCFFCGMWRPDEGLLTFSNAGMDPPVLFRRGRNFHEQLKKGGPVLGVQTDFHYRQGVVPLRPGDRLFLYTDGLTEERNTAGEFFEADRLLDLVDAHLQATPDRLLETIFSRVAEYGGPESSDDQTAMLLEIK